jgi:hypothetical protein
MSDEISPPITGQGRPAGDLTCGRGTPEDHCGAPATWHILWTADLSHGVVCDEHMAEARRRWVYVARHRIVADCTMPDALFFDDRCEVPMPPDLAALVAQEATSPLSRLYGGTR